MRPTLFRWGGEPAGGPFPTAPFHQRGDLSGMGKKQSRFLRGPRILPPPITKGIGTVDLLENHFLAYNAGRLREGARLFAEKMLQLDSTVGLSLSGALVPAGLGVSCIVPLLRAGFVDWIVSTGANLYPRVPFGPGMKKTMGDA